MNKSQRNAKAKAKGLRNARRKNKVNKIKNKEKKTTTYSTEETSIADCRGLNISTSTKYMLNPFLKFSRFATVKKRR